MVAGISGDSVATHARFARDNDLPFKFLADRGRAMAGKYGATNRSRSRWLVVVVGRDGRVRYIDSGFAVAGPESYVPLGAAIKAAREMP